MAEDDDRIAGIERLMVEEFLGVVFGALQPQQFAHAARAEHVVPHQARIGERVEPDIGAVARKRFLARQHRVAGTVEMNQAAVGERTGELGRHRVEGLLVGFCGLLGEFDQAADVKRGHGCDMPFPCS
jgi:hypothetical protein